MRIALGLLVLLGSLSVNAGEFDHIIKALAGQSNAIEQFISALKYHKGEGMPQNYKEAVRLYRSSAEQGFAKAQFNLALMYDRGEGMPQNYKEAVRWYRASAEQGHAAGQFALGLKCALGEGTIQDYKLAHMWSNLAAANGHEDAKTNRDIVAGKMTPADISEAQQMASDWKKAHP